MTTKAPERQRMSTTTFAVVALLVCVLLAGIASFYASGRPDGLNKVALDQGLAENEQESAAADSPLAGYSTKSVDNARLSGGVAGVVGVGAVLVIAGGAGYALRRRRGPGPEEG